MTTEQAYIKGFVKRASQYGFTDQEALGILKQAMPPELKELDYQSKMMTDPTLDRYRTQAAKTTAGTLRHDIGGNGNEWKNHRAQGGGFLQRHDVANYGTAMPTRRQIESQLEFDDYLRNKNSGGNQPQMGTATQNGNSIAPRNSIASPGNLKGMLGSAFSKINPFSSAAKPQAQPATSTNSPGGFFGPRNSIAQPSSVGNVPAPQDNFNRMERNPQPSSVGNVPAPQDNFNRMERNPQPSSVGNVPASSPGGFFGPNR